MTAHDLHNVVGVTTGTPIQGTVGLWCYAEDGSMVSQIKLRLGTDSSNYAEYTAETFSQRNGLDTGFILADGKNYLLFDLNNPDSVVGSIDWENINYARISWTALGATSLTFDYLTASKSNDIGLNGLGSRSTTYSSTTYTW